MLVQVVFSGQTLRDPFCLKHHAAFYNCNPLAKLSQGSDQVQMADLLRQDGKIYTVVIGLVIILTAMIILLLKVDRKLFRMEKQQKELK